MRIAALTVLVGLLPAACDKKPDAPSERPPPHVDPPADPGGDGPIAPDPVPDDPTAQRVRVVPDGHPDFPRLEGEGYPNACSADADCHAGGCSSEVCSAERGVITTCEAVEIDGWPSDAACGCVERQCRWHSPSGSTLGAAAEPEPKPDTKPDAKPEDCGGEVCTKPRQCIRYYGIAGKRGPQFASCEIRCKPGGTCPDDLSCVTIADGPGSVCR